MNSKINILTAIGLSGFVFCVYWLLFPASLSDIEIAARQIISGYFPSYPSPGYPIVAIPAIVIGLDLTLWLFLVQAILMLFCVYLCYVEFDIPIHMGIIAGLLPFVAVSSLAQTAAIPASLCFLAVVLSRRSYYWPSAILLGLCAIFRTELLLLLPAYATMRFREALFVFCVTVLTLFSLTGSVVSTNSPAVFYLSLGQLENNSWGIRPTDNYVDSVAKSRGVETWQSDGAEVFTRLSWSAIKSAPVEYTLKVIKNMIRAVVSGPYIGEWRVLHGWEWVKYPLHIVFGIFLLWLLWEARELTDSGRWVFVACILVLVSQGLGQQMVRHWNVIYLPLFVLIMEWKNYEKVRNDLLRGSVGRVPMVPLGN